MDSENKVKGEALNSVQAASIIIILLYNLLVFILYTIFIFIIIIIHNFKVIFIFLIKPKKNITLPFGIFHLKLNVFVLQAYARLLSLVLLAKYIDT